MGWEIMLAVVIIPGGIIIAAVLYGIARWEAHTKHLHQKMAAVRLPVSPKYYDPGELAGLPLVVQRYFRHVLAAGQPMISAVDIEHEGTFNASETGAQWRPFRSTQRVTIRRPGFDWNARIKMGPGVTVRVHDAYVAGEGLLHASLFGVVSLVSISGTADIAQGEFMRFLAEAAWYPTALLPSQGVRWEAVDDTAAQAALSDGQTAVAMVFRFNQNGLIESVRAEARGRIVKGRSISTPWEGRWQNYELRDGMRLPVQGEVAWILPQGPRPYWRGRITRIHFEFAP